jgi:ElaB/YqjD/DUF883 family membrane-anchored ribosome-binding protein
MSEATIESTAAAAAHRTIDEVRQLLDEARHPEHFAEVQERLRAALGAVEAAAQEAVGAAMPEASHAVADELAEAERRIRENPLGAVLVAAGVGLVAGLLLGRR